jgi:hypothetical protein
MNKEEKKEKKQKEQYQKIFSILSQNFSWIIVILIILSFIISYFFLIEPKLRQAITEIQGNIGQQENILIIQKQKLEQMQDNLNFYRKIQPADLEYLESIIPSPYPKEKLFGEIEDIVLQRGFILSSLNISEEDSTFDNLHIIKVDLEMSGIDYISLKSFLSVLEKHLPLMDIVNLDFSPEGENLSLIVNTYYFNN